VLRQCFTYDPDWAPRPLIDAPWLASLIWWLLAVVLLAITLGYAYRRERMARRESASTDCFMIDPLALAALCLIVPLQPAGEEYHYTLLLIVFLILFNQPGLVLLRSRTAGVGVALACILLALPSYFLQTAQWQGWPIATLAYPRLYGALLLWGMFMFRRDSGFVQLMTTSM